MFLQWVTLLASLPLSCFALIEFREKKDENGKLHHNLAPEFFFHWVLKKPIEFFNQLFQALVEIFLRQIIHTIHTYQNEIN